MGEDKRWDFFICHAFQDAREIAKPLCDALNAKGLLSWYADYSLKAGDNILPLIEFGLARSRFGIVIVSKQFLEMRWNQIELNDLASREVEGKKVILPVWHKIGFRDVYDYSPVLADRVAISTEKGLEYAVKRLWDAAKQPSMLDGIGDP
jgi:TIR domain